MGAAASLRPKPVFAAVVPACVFLLDTYYTAVKLFFFFFLICISCCFLYVFPPVYFITKRACVVF